MTRRLGWWIVTLLSLSIAAYALLLVVRPAIRPPFIASSPYPWAVLAHFLGGGASLALGPWQFRTGPRTPLTPLHRWMGRAYAVAVLVGGVAGLLLSTVAMGGAPGRLGFAALAVAWLVSLTLAVRYARNGAIDAHREWMMRNFALTFAAVTLRVYIPASIMLGIPFEQAYPAIAWLAWVPNLVVAEWLLRSRQTAMSPRRA